MHDTRVLTAGSSVGPRIPLRWLLTTVVLLAALLAAATACAPGSSVPGTVFKDMLDAVEKVESVQLEVDARIAIQDDRTDEVVEVHALGAVLVDPDAPPWDVPGMIGLRLDPEGRLTCFRAIPPRFDDSEETVAGFEWSTFFEAAGIEPGAPAANSPAATPAAWPRSSRCCWRPRSGRDCAPSPTHGEPTTCTPRVTRYGFPSRWCSTTPLRLRSS